jgi:acyl-CoA dehydrogenase
VISLDVDPLTQKLRHEVRAWALSEVRPHARQADRDHHAPPPARVAEILSTMPVTLSDESLDEVGPGDGQAVLATLVIEETTYGDHWINWELPGSGIGRGTIKKLGTPAQKAKWLGGMKDGTYDRAAFALTEAHCGSDPARLATTATRDGETWVLNGTKIYCSGGATSDLVVVFATVDKSLGRDGVRAFVVPRDAPGFVVTKANEHKLGIRSSQTAELLFDDCVIPLDNCLGWTDHDAGSDQPAGMSGFQGAVTTLDNTRPGIAAMSLGLARAAVDETAGWFAERRSYFTPERRDRVQCDLDRMRERIDVSRLAIHRAAWLADQNRDNRREASIAKAHGPVVAEQVIRRCLQLMGPDGWSEEYLVEKWYRDVKIFDIFEGSGQIQRMIVSRYAMGPAAARG